MAALSVARSYLPLRWDHMDNDLLMDAILSLRDKGLIEQLPNGEWTTTELARTGKIVVDPGDDLDAEER